MFLGIEGALTSLCSALYKIKLIVNTPSNSSRACADIYYCRCFSCGLPNRFKSLRAHEHLATCCFLKICKILPKKLGGFRIYHYLCHLIRNGSVCVCCNREPMSRRRYTLLLSARILLFQSTLDEQTITTHK